MEKKQKIEKQQKEIEDKTKAERIQEQQEHEQHIQMLENIHQLFRDYEGDLPSHIKKEIFISPKHTWKTKHTR